MTEEGAMCLSVSILEPQEENHALHSSHSHIDHFFCAAESVFYGKRCQY